MTEDIQQVHELILTQLLEHRKTHPDFTFSLRKNDISKKLSENRYWFLGNQDYIFVPLFARNNALTKTKSIGLVYKPTGQNINAIKYKLYIEIVCQQLNNPTDEDIEFHRELAKRYDAVTKEDNHHYIHLKESDITQYLSRYIGEFRNTCLKLLKEYGLDGTDSTGKGYI